MATLAPLAARFFAIAAPMPSDAPVIKATLFLNVISFLIFLIG
jgi:hypothetical protein